MVRVEGVITAMKTGYGFLRMRGGPKAFFIHGNQVLLERDRHLEETDDFSGRRHHAASVDEVMQVGNEVEFSVPQVLVDLNNEDFARLSQKPAALSVVLLAKESVPVEDPRRVEGVVSKVLQCGKRNILEAYGGCIKYVPDDSEGDVAGAETQEEGQEEGEGEGAGEGEGKGGRMGEDAAVGSKEKEVDGNVTSRELEISFEGSDLCDVSGARLDVGSCVSFVLQKDSKWAHGVLLVGQGACPDPAESILPQAGQGVVCMISHNRYGFIRTEDSEQQLFFHMDDVPAESQETMSVGSEVSFFRRDDRNRTGKKIARNLRVLPKGTISYEDNCGHFTGTILRLAVAPRSKGVDDGLVEFFKPAQEDIEQSKEGATEELTGGGEKSSTEGPGIEQRIEVLYGTHCIDDPRLRLSPGDTISFQCFQNKATRRRRIARIELVKKGSGAEDSTPELSLGRLSTLKKTFGFIQSVSEIAEIFFHFDNLAEGVDRSILAPGMDVQFLLSTDPSTRTVALQVAPVPKGTAVFESEHDEVLHGVVTEQAFPRGSGLVRAEVDGQDAHLPFSYGDVLEPRNFNPRVGEHVEFRIITDLKRERAAEAIGKQGLGRRATSVQLAPRPGRVLDIVGSYGFIQCRLSAEELAVRNEPATSGDPEVEGPAPGGGASPSPTPAADNAADAEKPPPLSAPASSATASGSTDKGRVFFHETAVLDGVRLAPGDEVEFVLRSVMYKNKRELNALSVRRVTVAAEVQPEARPESMKFTGGRRGVSKATPQMRLAKGPDGTPGFHPGRGRRLNPPPGVLESLPSLALGEAPATPAAAPPAPEEVAALPSPSPAARGEPAPPTSAVPPGLLFVRAADGSMHEVSNEMLQEHIRHAMSTIRDGGTNEDKPEA